MTRIRFEDVEVGVRGAKPLLDTTSFDLAPGTTLVLCGETGSGKSLLLELMAGLRRPSSGRVLHDDREASKIPGARRSVGMAFQNGQLYEHLDVRRNIGFALRDRRSPEIEDAAKIACCLDVLNDHRGRVHTLSGGERRRVALAKALITNPSILLLDEPFSGLDPITRDRLRRSLSAHIRSRTGTTVLALHELEDALAFGDRIMLLHEGRIIADGTPEDLLKRPPSCEAALRMRHPVPTRMTVEIRKGTLTLPGGATNAPADRSDGRYDFVLPAHAATIEEIGDDTLTGWRVVERLPVQDGVDLLLAHESLDPSDPISCLRVRDTTNGQLELGTMVDVRFEIENGQLFPSDR
ncbi:MAG: hypothetical protein CMJ33_01320 [Phycisphaerae bacterium]|nr:hypothetical protein [Phycisphaerae bacterium]